MTQDLASLLGSSFMNYWNSSSGVQNFVGSLANSLYGSYGSGFWGSNGLYGSLIGSTISGSLLNSLLASGISSGLDSLLGSLNYNYGSLLPSAIGTSGYGSGVSYYSLLHGTHGPVYEYNNNGYSLSVSAGVAHIEDMLGCNIGNAGYGASVRGSYNGLTVGGSYQQGYGATGIVSYNNGTYSVSGGYNSGSNSSYVNGTYSNNGWNVYGRYSNNNGNSNASGGVKYANNNLAFGAGFDQSSVLISFTYTM